MRVLSLFDGMSCAQIALRNFLRVPDNMVYMASEVDKHAIKVCLDNFPNTIQLGGVENVKNLRNIDLLVGGPPCQDLSIAKGKGRKGLEGSKSKLFWEYLRVLREVKPLYFLMENVATMKNADRDIISKELGVEPIMINSALVSAQQRKRYYWTNIPVELPEDKGIVLEDIIQKDLTQYDLQLMAAPKHYFEGTELEQYLSKTRKEVIFNYSSSGRGNGKVEDRFYESSNEKAHALTATGYTKRSFTGVSHPVRLGALNKSQGNRVYLCNGKSISLNASSGGLGGKTGLYHDDFCIRKLTVLESKRLQTVPDSYRMEVSKTQALKMLGNGFTVKVIEHILKGMRV